MDATIVFRGSARASSNPRFVDQCVSLLNPAHWRDVGPLTIHLFPGSPLYATIAWRNEVFAYAFPLGKDEIALGRSGEQERASCLLCTGACTNAVKALAKLLDQYLAERTENREQWMRKAGEERNKIHAVIAE